MTDETRLIGKAQRVRAYIMRAGTIREITLSRKVDPDVSLALGRSELEDLRLWIDEVLADVRRLEREAAQYIEEATDGYELAEHEGHQDAYQSVIHLIEQAMAERSQPTEPQAEQPQAEPWEPKDLAEEQARYDADTIKGLTAEIEAMLRHLLTLAGKQGETDTRLDEFAQWFSQWFSAIARELMRHDKRIEALDAKP